MLNITDLIAKAKALRDEIQQAITDGEHIIETVKGDVPTGQLVVAAGAATTLVTNLENHVAAAQSIVDAAKTETPAK